MELNRCSYILIFDELVQKQFASKFLLTWTTAPDKYSLQGIRDFLFKETTEVRKALQNHVPRLPPII